MVEIIETLDTNTNTGTNKNKSNSSFNNMEENDIKLPDPLILHQYDTPGLTLVNTPLNGQNYGEWSRAMRLSLNPKNKLGIVDGTIQPPSPTDPKFPMWQRCNDLVLTWIIQSIHPEIARSVIFSKTASAVWSDLQDRFSQADDSRIYQIRQEIIECQQGSQSVSAYFTKLKALWDELASYQEPIDCACDMLKKLIIREEKERVMQFLMGLNETYFTVRGSILMMSPLLNTQKVHGLILQHERQMEAATRREHPPISHAMQVTRPTPKLASKPSFSSSYRKPLKCTYCEGDTHLVDTCYFLKGFPVGHKWHGKDVKPIKGKHAAHNIELKEPTDKSYTFTAKEYQEYMAMLQEKKGKNQHYANATGHGYEEDDWPGQAC